MDINSIYIRMKATQNPDKSVNCKWDFSDAFYYDINGENEQILTQKELSQKAIYAPDSENPLFIIFPKKIKFEYEGNESEEYKTQNVYFTIGELLETVRLFTEKRYNEKYTDQEYDFEDLYFTGVKGFCGLFSIEWEATNNIMHSFGNITDVNQLMALMAPNF